MIVYNDIMERLAEAGYSAYRLQKEGIMSNSTMDRIRHNKAISTETINTICLLCQCQPGELIRYEPEKRERK